MWRTLTNWNTILDLQNFADSHQHITRNKKNTHRQTSITNARNQSHADIHQDHADDKWNIPNTATFVPTTVKTMPLTTQNYKDVVLWSILVVLGIAIILFNCKSGWDDKILLHFGCNLFCNTCFKVLFWLFVMNFVNFNTILDSQNLADSHQHTVLLEMKKKTYQGTSITYARNRNYADDH